MFNRTGIGFEAPGDDLEQRGLSRPVCADHSDAIAALELVTEILDNNFLVVTLGDTFQTDDLPAETAAAKRREGDVAGFARSELAVRLS